ncbi:MAG: hypothetical protein JW819_11945 [Candidatus Krumholzibacteriota bacterium]|nr:hypothetical protein [Candidatus Krumholzibacteriota bacterium]
MTTRPLLAALVLLLATAAGAVETEHYTYARLEDYSAFSFRDLVLQDDGTWHLGPHWEEKLADEAPVFSGMADDGERLLVAASGGPNKLILFEKASGRHRLLRASEDRFFSAVAAVGPGRWVAAAGPGGEIWEVTEAGVTPLLDTGEAFVWSLLVKGGVLWIGTGGDGWIYRHDLARGVTDRFADLPDQNVLSLAVDAEGRLLAGTSGKGLLYRLPEEGRHVLLADFDAEEIQGILPALDGTLTLAVARGGECTENCGAVYRLDAEGRLEKMLSSDSGYLGDLVRAPSGVWVATGDPAELDLLTDLYRGEVLGADPPVFYSDLHWDGEALWLLQSKPARLLRIAGRAREGTLTSEVLDLTSRAHAGAVRVEGDIPQGCAVTVEARAGQGAEPGPGWTEWAPCRREDGAFRMDLPAARYFQWRATLSGRGDATPRLGRFTASFLPLNRSPLLGNLSVLRPAEGPFDEGIDLMGRPVTQVLERGVRVQYQDKNGPLPADETAARHLAGLRQVSWDWVDPDGDQLQARIELRREGEDAWQVLAEGWQASRWTWDTRGLPDGRYRLRVTVDDALVNVPGEIRRMAAVSEPLRLDSSAPAFDLDVDREKDGRLRLRGKVRDAGGGIVARLEHRADGEQWLPLAGADGLMDRPELALDLRLAASTGGVLELRACDEFGNWSYFRREIAP